MAKPKDLRRYPMEFFELLNVLDGRERYEIAFATKKEAEAFRFNFYGFIKALSLVPAEDRNYRIAAMFTIKVGQGGLLTFESVDQSSQAKAIRNSFGLNAVDLMKQQPIPQPSAPTFHSSAAGERDKMQETLDKLGYGTGLSLQSPSSPPPGKVEKEGKDESGENNT